jgi:hypothetical protein
MFFLRNQFINDEVKFYKIMGRFEFNLWVYTGHSNAPSTSSMPSSVSTIASHPRRALRVDPPLAFNYPTYENDNDLYANPDK